MSKCTTYGKAPISPVEAIDIAKKLNINLNEFLLKYTTIAHTDKYIYVCIKNNDNICIFYKNKSCIIDSCNPMHLNQTPVAVEFAKVFCGFINKIGYERITSLPFDEMRTLVSKIIDIFYDGYNLTEDSEIQVLNRLQEIKEGIINV